MLKYFSYNILIIYGLLCSVILLILFIILRPLVNYQDYILFVDCTFSAILCTGLSVLLKDTVKYANYKSLSMFQCIINYLALGVLFVLITVGLGFYLFYLFFWSADEFATIYATIPVRTVIFLLFFCCMVLFYEFIFRNRTEDNNIYECNNGDIEEVPHAEKKEEPLEQITIKSGHKIDIISVNDIVCLQAEGDYVMIYTQSEHFLKEQTMKYFETHLPANRFVRVHRSNIVNVDFISRIEIFEKQNQLLKLTNGMGVKVSVTGYKNLKRTLGF